MADVDELNPSELGTKEYWDKQYKLEKVNFDDNGDEGEVWFGESAMYRVVRWLLKSEIELQSRVIDLGCGNGVFSLELAASGFTNVTGVDYCEAAIELSKKVAESRNLAGSVDFKTFDILGPEDGNEQFDVAIDKGTYDAISLSSDAKSARICYLENVAKMLKPKSLLIITSCNWTEPELTGYFTGKYFDVRAVLPTPQFKFGGKVGNNVTTVVFSRKS